MQNTKKIYFLKDKYTPVKFKIIIPIANFGEKNLHTIEKIKAITERHVVSLMTILCLFF